MASIKNPEKLQSFLDIIDELSRKTYEKNSYGYVYENSSYNVKEKPLKALDEDALIQELKKVLGNKEEAYDFLTQRIDVKEIYHIFFNKKNNDNVFYSLIEPLLDNENELTISPLLICMTFNNNDLDRVDNLLKSYLSEKENDFFYDRLIQDKKGTWFNSLDIINEYFKLGSNPRQHIHGKTQALEHDSFMYRLKESSVNRGVHTYSNPFIKKMLIDMAEKVSYGNLNFNIEPEKIHLSIFLVNITNEKVKDLVREKVLKNASVDFLNAYITDFYQGNTVISPNALQNIFSLLNKDTEVINDWLKTKLLKENALGKMVKQLEINKENRHTIKDKIRTEIDNTYLSIFKGIYNLYGKEFFNGYIQDINNKSNNALENIIGLAKVKIETTDEFLFYSLLKNENRETVNYLLENGYNPHISEKNEINKGRKYKNLISVENLKKMNNLIEEIDLKDEVRLLLGNINKGNLKKLSEIIKNRRNEFNDLINETRELDKNVHYFYYSSTNLLSPDFLSNVSPIMNIILSGQADVINLLLENNIEFTAKEKSLLYFAFYPSKKVTVDPETYGNNIINYIEKEDGLQDLFYNTIISGSLEAFKNSGRWNNKTDKIFSMLFDKYYTSLSEKEKLVFLDTGFAQEGRSGMSFLIYDKLSNEEKEIFLNYKKVENEDNYIEKEIRNLVRNHSNKRDFIISLFGKIQELILKNIQKDETKAEKYLNVLKSQDKQIDFNNIDILDGTVAAIEKIIIINSLSDSINLNSKTKNRL